MVRAQSSLDSLGGEVHRVKQARTPILSLRNAGVNGPTKLLVELLQASQLGASNAVLLLYAPNINEHYIDVEPERWRALYVAKLRACHKLADFSDAKKDTEFKEHKKETMIDLIDTLDDVANAQAYLFNEAIQHI